MEGYGHMKSEDNSSDLVKHSGDNQLWIYAK